jgi:hypothetical protein
MNRCHVARGLAAQTLALVLIATPAFSHEDAREDGLIDGGGNPSKDCISKFQTGLELNYPTKKPKELRCTDGDLACDTDGAVDGSCTFSVATCLADDEDMPLCRPTGISAGGVVYKNKPLGHPRHDTGVQQMQDEVDTLLGASGVACDNPGGGGGNCFVCTASATDLVAPLSVKRGKKRLKLKATSDPAPATGKAIRDSDKLKMRCVECEKESTLEHIADIVFTGSCAMSAACHTGATPAAGLNLDASAIGLSGVYDELVNEAATSPGAAALGLARILPGDAGLGTAITGSLLYEKLARTQSQIDDLCIAGGEPAGCLGGHMPPGSDVFSPGKLDLIAAWIQGGAPSVGWVAGATCGEPEDLWMPATPPAPPAPGAGFQMHMPQPYAYTLAPGTEFEGCQVIEVPASVTEDWYIDRIEVIANVGTHHIVLWSPTSPTAPTGFDSTDVACLSAIGSSVPLVVSQDPIHDVSMPTNTAMKMGPGDTIGFNPHYSNVYNVDIYPEIWVNFYGSTTPATAEVLFVGSSGAFGFPGTFTFVVPPYQTGFSDLVEWDSWGASPICLFSMTTHQHRRGIGMKTWSSAPSSWADDTDALLHSTDWDHPGWLEPSPPLHLRTGIDSMWLQCEWDNGVLADVNRRCLVTGEGPAPHECGVGNPFPCITNADCPGTITSGVCRDCDLDFGVQAEDEMCFVLAYAYEAQPGPDPCPWE